MTEQSEHAMVLTTTLRRVRQENACEPGYAILLAGLGLDFEDDRSINLLTILKINGTHDCIWALRATEQDCARLARLMAADFAEALLPAYEERYPGDLRPRNAIEAARAFALGQIGPEERRAARAAAARAAWAAAEAAAEAAAAEAAAAAAEAAAAEARAAWAAWVAAAAEAAARARDAGSWGGDQAAILRRYLLEGE